MKIRLFSTKNNLIYLEVINYYNNFRYYYTVLCLFIDKYTYFCTSISSGYLGSPIAIIKRLQGGTFHLYIVVTC